MRMVRVSDLGQRLAVFRRNVLAEVFTKIVPQINALRLGKRRRKLKQEGMRRHAAETRIGKQLRPTEGVASSLDTGLKERRSEAIFDSRPTGSSLPLLQSSHTAIRPPDLSTRLHSPATETIFSRMDGARNT